MRPALAASVLLASTLLVACGGGGSSGSGPEANPATYSPAQPSTRGYDALRAWTNLHSTTRSWTVSGVASDSKSYELSLSTAPGGTMVFPVSGATATQTVFRNVMKEGATLVQDVTNEQFIDAQYRQLGARVTAPGIPTTCSKTEVIAALPLAGSPAGTTGPLFAATTLADCSATATSLGTSYHTWSVLDEAGVVYFCVTSSNRFIGQTSDQVSETCIQTDASGTLGDKARIRLVLPGFNITATN